MLQGGEVVVVGVERSLRTGKEGRELLGGLSRHVLIPMTVRDIDGNGERYALEAPRTAAAHGDIIEPPVDAAADVGLHHLISAPERPPHRPGEQVGRPGPPTGRSWARS